MTEPSAFSLAVGARLGRYEVLKPLARGGMGEVYLGRVHGESATRPVALKILRPELQHDGEVRSMFADEAAMLLRLDHTSIVRAVEIVQDGDRVVLVMEYVRGRSGSALLRAWKDRPPESSAVAVEIGIRVARAVHHVHEARGDDGVRLGLVHRDLSPDNVMLRPDGGVKLIDFGIARATAQTSMTSAGVLKGKVSYMSPEQLRQDPLDRRSDVFQLGTLLFELVTRRHPFAGNNFAATVNAILSGDAPDPREHVQDLDDALAEAITRALEFEPEDRFETAAEFAAALEDALRHSSEESRGDLEAEYERTFGEPNATDEPTIVVGSSGVRPRSRRWVAAAAACTIAGLAAAGVALVTWQDVGAVTHESAAMDALVRSRAWGGTAIFFVLAALGLGWFARRRRAAAVVLGAALTSCGTPERSCTEAAPCDLHEHGYCDADSMRCVYPDESCAGGHRWGPFAGASSQQCLGAPAREDVAVARPITATPTLDGDPHELMFGAPTRVTSSFGVSAELWFRTSDVGLYVGAVITDPLLEASRPSYQPLWEEDGLELLFDTAWDRGPGQMPGTDDYKFVVTAVNATSVSWAGVSPRTAWSLPIESAVRTQGTLNQPSDADGGYTIELLVPWGAGFERPTTARRGG